MSTRSTPLVHALFARYAEQSPGALAIQEVDGESVSFADLERQTSALAGWAADSTRRGDRVAVVADNCPDYVRLYYAIPASGRILALINQRFTPLEQAAMIGVAGAAVVVGHRTHLDRLRDVLKGPSLPRLVDLESPEFRDALRSEPAGAAEQVDADDPAWLLFTGGSTGVPKGVLHSHRSLTAGVQGVVVERRLQAGGVYLLPFPMCHIVGHHILSHQAAGSAVVPVSSFRPDAFVRAVNEYGVTFCSLAPTMLHALVAYVEQSGATMPTLHSIAYGSSAMPGDLIRRAFDALDVDFYQSYGQTESGGSVTFLTPADHRKAVTTEPALLRSVGRPHDDVELAVLDDAWEAVATGGVGEVAVRGPQVMLGYWRDNAASAEAIADGWLRTGDVGYVDDSGHLFLVDRRKDLIVTGGENVSSVEVEDVLVSHPKVSAVAVVGVPDEYWGEAICAVVVAEPGTSPTATELVEHVRSRIAPFKRPRHVVFVDGLPLTTIGKVSKQDVRKQARELLGLAAAGS